MTYTVVPGDTLYAIAERHNITLEQLYALNPGSSDHVYDLQPGTVLRVSQQQGQQQQQQNQYQAPEPQQQQQQQQNTYGQEQKVHDEQQHEEKHGLFESTGAKIAAGVLGTAAVAGLGAFAVHEYKEHQKKQEEKKQY
ncbi:UNVERIFIED_CONTAM: hypothetical protein HDU68_007860 [Siphonaria sp. JEL0065]|nr:hypothetical protein HDU68_007860 [Siphonaria sp. JEL0065]